MNSGYPFGAPQRIPQAYPLPQQQTNNANNNAQLQQQQQPQQNLAALNRRRPIRMELSDEQKAEIREAFEIFDMDKDGALDFHEFKVRYIFHF